MLPLRASVKGQRVFYELRLLNEQFPLLKKRNTNLEIMAKNSLRVSEGFIKLAMFCNRFNFSGRLYRYPDILATVFVGYILLYRSTRDITRGSDFHTSLYNIIV